eukprot:11148831-Alexandrium_andersonii.AAC.1
MAPLPAGALGAPVVALPQLGCVGSSSTLWPPWQPPGARLSPNPPGSGGPARSGAAEAAGAW